MNNLIKEQMEALYNLARGVKSVKINYQDHSEEAVKINGTYRCPECETHYKQDEDLRVEANLKCSRCAYQYGI